MGFSIVSRSFLFCVVVSLGIGACSDRPSRERFPGPQGRTTDVQQAQTTQAVLGGIDPLNNPLAPTQDRANVKREIRGKVVLAKGLRAPAGVLFVSARPIAGGPPMAALRIENPVFPVEFQLTEANRMMAGVPFEGDVLLTVKLSQSGDPLGSSPGDLIAGITTRVGESSLQLTLEASN